MAGSASEVICCACPFVVSVLAKSELELQQLRIRMTELASSELADAEIRAVFGDFDTLWKSVSQREQLKLMEVLVERVEYDPHEVEISVDDPRAAGNEA